MPAKQLRLALVAYWLNGNSLRLLLQQVEKMSVRAGQAEIPLACPDLIADRQFKVPRLVGHVYLRASLFLTLLRNLYHSCFGRGKFLTCGQICSYSLLLPPDDKQLADQLQRDARSVALNPSITTIWKEAAGAAGDHR